jgi:hypothetical protein
MTQTLYAHMNKRNLKKRNDGTFQIDPTCAPNKLIYSEYKTPLLHVHMCTDVEYIVTRHPLYMLQNECPVLAFERLTLWSLAHTSSGPNPRVSQSLLSLGSTL